jgi:lipopolysaccharide export system protein LptA
MGSSAPFSHSDRPVFITAETAEFDVPSDTAVYTGNARGWQENNYVRGGRFTIYQREGKFVAEDHVQSAAYNARIGKKGGGEAPPVFASAASMVYLRDARLLQYRTDADIRQGTDRITSASADLYLNEKNEISRTIAETSVVITQPGRRATGDWAQYTADDEVAVLKGNPARVDDAENGTSQAAQITMNMRDKRVVSEGRAKQAVSGRIKSVYKVQTKQ